MKNLQKSHNKLELLMNENSIKLLKMLNDEEESLSTVDITVQFNSLDNTSVEYEELEELIYDLSDEGFIDKDTSGYTVKFKIDRAYTNLIGQTIKDFNEKYWKS